MEPASSTTSRRSFVASAALPLLKGKGGKRKLLVVSIDGLDHRYVRDADKLGLRIENIRRIAKEGQWADGVVGVVPTVTWPSHTTIATGVTPEVHGILSNNRPKEGGGERYWSNSLMKVPALWDAAREAKLKTAAVEWPVTVGAKIDFNIPEVFKRRSGGGMDMDAHEKDSTPGLIEKITAEYPSFATEFLDDRGRALAVVYLFKKEQPDLTLVHMVDHDDAAHANGPFSKRANATLEYADELLGQMIAAAPKGTVVALVSDHGFERVERTVDPRELLRHQKVDGEVTVTPTLAFTKDAKVAALLRKHTGEAAYGIGREVPASEIERLAPKLAGTALFEPMEHMQFGMPTADAREGGSHGYWPLRRDYRATFALWGPGVKRERLPEIDMLSIASRLAAVLDLDFPKEKPKS